MIRTFLLSLMLGAVCGYGVMWLGMGSDMSMAATFVGAILPVLWHARQNRIGGAD